MQVIPLDQPKLSFPNTNQQNNNNQQSVAVYSQNITNISKYPLYSLKINNFQETAPPPPICQSQEQVLNINEDKKENNTIDKTLKQLRIGFIRKVYGIFTTQLLITFGAVCLSFINKVKEFIITHSYISYIIAGIALVIFVILLCRRKSEIKVPLNYILLISWTICLSYLLLTCASYFDKDIVICAIGLTFIVSVALTIYACCIKVDFTYWGSLLSICSFVFACYGLFGLWFRKWIYCLYCVIGILLFSVYLVYDTQLIIGDKTNRYSMESYIIAAMNLYVDIVQLFLNLLALVGILKKH